MESVEETNTQQPEPMLPSTNMSPPREEVRTYSNPTLEQVIARQQAAAQQQAKQHWPPQILPRPATAPPPAPDDPPRSKTPARKATKSTVESKPREHQNKCPAQGTREASLRTIEASIRRCTSQDKILALLAKKGFTEEEYNQYKAKKDALAASKPKSKARAKSAKDATNEMTPVPQSASQSQSSWRTRREQPLLNTEKIPPLRDHLSDLWGPGGKHWINDPHQYAQLRQDAEEINQYYSGRGRPHLFCIIARFKNVQENSDTSQALEYLCCSAARHLNINGNEALQLTASILSSVQRNAGPVRCDIQSGDDCFNKTGILPRFMILDSILESCFASISKQEPQLYTSGGDRGFYQSENFHGANFILDVTDPSEPRYCYMHCHERLFRIHCYHRKDLGIAFHHAPVLRTNKTYQYTHTLASYGIVKAHAIQSAWPHLCPEIIPPLPLVTKRDNVSEDPLDRVVAYDNRCPVVYPPDLASQSDRKAEEVLQILQEFFRYPRNRYYTDLEHIYLPFAPFMSPSLLTELTDFYSKSQGLTLAGNDIFKTPEICDILDSSGSGLVYLNLLSCDIPEEGLAVIRNMPMLDTFIHESTILPGLKGFIPPEVQGSRKSLKINLTYVFDTPRLPTDKLESMMAEYTFSRDKSILFRRGLRALESAAQHPFMGPISAVTCLKELITIFSDPEFSKDWIQYLSFLKGVFCKGYRSDVQVGLPVGMSPEPWEDYVDDDGTRLMITHWAGHTYACFSEWRTDLNGGRVLEKFTVYDYLMKYTNECFPGEGPDVIEICEGLKDWCGDGFKVLRHQDGVRSTSMELEDRLEKSNEKEMRLQYGDNNLSEVMGFGQPSSVLSSGEDGETEIEDI